METGAKSQPKLANENPWYCLATLHGEQRGTEIDHDLAARNRVAWNRWMAAGRLGPRLGDEQRADLLRRNLPKADLTELTPHQQREFYELFAARTGCARILVPNPDDIVDFRHTQFDVPLAFAVSSVSDRPTSTLQDSSNKQISARQFSSETRTSPALRSSKTPISISRHSVKMPRSIRQTSLKTLFS